MIDFTPVVETLQHPSVFDENGFKPRNAVVLLETSEDLVKQEKLTYAIKINMFGGLARLVQSAAEAIPGPAHNSWNGMIEGSEKSIAARATEIQGAIYDLLLNQLISVGGVIPPMSDINAWADKTIPICNETHFTSLIASLDMFLSKLPNKGCLDQIKMRADAAIAEVGLTLALQNRGLNVIRGTKESDLLWGIDIIAVSRGAPYLLIDVKADWETKVALAKAFTKSENIKADMMQYAQQNPIWSGGPKGVDLSKIPHAEVHMPSPISCSESYRDHNLGIPTMDLVNSIMRSLGAFL